MALNSVCVCHDVSVKRRLLILVVLVLVAVAASPWGFRTFVEGSPDPALTLPAGGQPASTGVDGSWTVQPDSQAGYRARQKLLYQPIDVSGRTSKVAGNAEVAGSRLVSADFTVDTATLQSAHRGRDEKFASTDVIDAKKFPTAEVKITAPVDLTSVPDTGKPVDVQIPLVLTLHGVTRPESAHTSIQRNGDRVDVAGTIPIKFADYDVHPPKLLGGVLEIQPDATIEFLVHLAKA